MYFIFYNVCTHVTLMNKYKYVYIIFYVLQIFFVGACLSAEFCFTEPTSGEERT